MPDIEQVIKAAESLEVEVRALVDIARLVRASKVREVILSAAQRTSLRAEALAHLTDAEGLLATIRQVL